MEAFTLLKYWRGGGAASLRGKNEATPTPTTTIMSVTENHLEVDGDDDVDGDEGPFFDLEFTVPDDVDNENGSDFEQNDDVEKISESGSDDDEEDDNGFKFTLSSGSSNEEDGDDRTDQNLVLSPPSDGGDDSGNNLFFKGKLVPIEAMEPNSKPQFPVSFLKSATKFRVFMLGFKKSKPNIEKPITESITTNGCTKKENFTVKFKVEEVKPIVSLFTRDNSSRHNTKLSLKHNISSTEADEKRFSKELMQKYLKKVKPLYVRVSKRYGDKLKPSPPPHMAEKVEGVEAGGGEKTVKQEGSFYPAGLRVVCKHLGKSRSASSAAVAAAPSPVAVAPSRRDDSLLQQQDGIQSAILHCKRSFIASRESESSLLLSRSVSDPSHEKSIDLSRKSSSADHEVMKK